MPVASIATRLLRGKRCRKWLGGTALVVLVLWGLVVSKALDLRDRKPTHLKFVKHIKEKEKLLKWGRRPVENSFKKFHDEEFRWVARQGEMGLNSYHEDEQNEYDGDVGNFNDLVPVISEEEHARMLFYPKRRYTERVLILSPIHNVGHMLEHYAAMLLSLTYPHELISVALGEDSSTDDTMKTAKKIEQNLSKSFRKVQALQLNISGGIHGDWETIHDPDFQLARRRHLADARNLLLKAALDDEDWVLWIDSDVGSMPPDIVQQLLSAGKEIVVPLCIMKDEGFGEKRVYDKNTWRETPKSLKKQQSMDSGELMLEGYSGSYRVWLSDLRHEGRVVALDGVGGCTLLVKADCHRKGLIFPNNVYKHHIETEGLAKLAKDMKFGVYGMPFVEVLHS